MIIIKKIKNILFFFLIVLIIIFLLSKLGLISFLLGFINALLPFFAGLFISVCLEPVITRFIDKGYKRKMIVIVTYVVLLSTIGLVSIIFLPTFINQIQIFIETLPNLINDFEHLLSRLGLKINANNILNSFQFRFEKIIEYLTSGFNVIIAFGIAISCAFFISYDYKIVRIKIKDLIPNIIKNETIYFFNRFEPYFSKYIYSILIDSLITFVISIILFLIFKIDYFLIGALIITITNLIPFIGTLLGIIPLAIIGYSISPYVAIISISIVLLVQLLESNIIQPLIFKNVIKLHPIEGLIGVLIFSYLFGAIGIIFSPLLVIAFKLLFIEKYPLEQSHFDSTSIQ